MPDWRRSVRGVTLPQSCLAEAITLSKDTFDHVVSSFTRDLADQRVEIYNEFSLQHELGLHLRDQFTSFKVQFERNVTYFFSEKVAFTKKEIDNLGVQQ